MNGDLTGRNGHDFTAPNLDALAIFYTATAVIYTLIVLCALFGLFLLRNTHAVRIRNFAAICATVMSLHVYLVLILLVYPLNGLFKCGWEFWIMSILLPLGMALFQGMPPTVTVTPCCPTDASQPPIFVSTHTPRIRKQLQRASFAAVRITSSSSLHRVLASGLSTLALRRRHMSPLGLASWYR
jgi:hypothetical protein